jgi:hypothetical protein
MQLVFPAPLGPTSTTMSPPRRKASRAIIAEMRQAEAADAGGGHIILFVIAGLDPAIHRPR